MDHSWTQFLALPAMQQFQRLVTVCWETIMFFFSFLILFSGLCCCNLCHSHRSSSTNKEVYLLVLTLPDLNLEWKSNMQLIF